MVTHTTRTTKDQMLAAVHKGWNRAKNLARFAGQKNAGKARNYLRIHKNVAELFDNTPTMKSKTVRETVQAFKNWLGHPSTTVKALKTPRAGKPAHLKIGIAALKVDRLLQPASNGPIEPSKIPAAAAIDLRNLQQTHNLSFDELRYTVKALENIVTTLNGP